MYCSHSWTASPIWFVLYSNECLASSSSLLHLCWISSKKIFGLLFNISFEYLEKGSWKTYQKKKRFLKVCIVELFLFALFNEFLLYEEKKKKKKVCKLFAIFDQMVDPFCCWLGNAKVSIEGPVPQTWNGRCFHLLFLLSRENAGCLEGFELHLVFHKS